MKARELTGRLLANGFLPDHLTPSFTSASLPTAYRQILDYLRPLKPTRRKKTGSYPRAKVVRHSVPKQRLSRRYLSIPNPVHHVLVARAIATNWQKLCAFCSQSKISLSGPKIGVDRALEPGTLKRLESRERAIRSIGKKFLLKADLARFYPSIYMHSIPWALHGKDATRRNSALYGNRLDERIRESQDKQTAGIPTGPDTSFLVAETIATALDLAVEKRVGVLHGTRYIDDYHLYFDSYSEAESALAALHEAAAALELEVNDTKTAIVATPEPLEPDWKIELRRRAIGSASSDQESEIIDLFSRAAALAEMNPHDNVLTFAAKMVGGFEINSKTWPLCEALLLRSAMTEPRILRVLLDIYDTNGNAAPDTGKLAQTVDSICVEHAALQHGNEVLWALWAARSHDLHIDARVAKALSSMDDDLVALSALHLSSEGQIDGLDTSFWQQFITKEQLYEHHWLLAYEAPLKGWLGPANGRDYIGADPFFNILNTSGVSFYNSEATHIDDESEYSDDDSDDLADFTSSLDEDETL
jgi:hypothetical protein